MKRPFTFKHLKFARKIVHDLGRKVDIIPMHTLSSADVDQLKNLKFGVFTGSQAGIIVDKKIYEPLSSTLSLSTFYQFCNYTVDHAIYDEMSFVAKDCNSIVSFICNKDYIDSPFAAPCNVEMLEMDPNWDPIKEIFTQLDTPFYAKNNPQKGEYFHLWCAGTMIDPYYRRQGIAKELFKKSMNLAISKGYKYAVADVSSKITQDILCKMGFEKFNEIVYKDFEFPKGVFSFSNPNASSPENKSIQLLVKPLT
jgi:GNAT superfamily N-acetyltransferase